MKKRDDDYLPSQRKVRHEEIYQCPYCQSRNIKISEIDTKEELSIFSCNMVCNNKHEFVFALIPYPEYDEVRSYVIFVTDKYKKIKYKEYIASPEWKERVLQLKEKCGWRCQLCNKPGTKRTLHAHHRTYDNLGCELEGDIIILCSECHAKFHNKTVME
jgi:transcription elongation factor Elf1